MKRSSKTEHYEFHLIDNKWLTIDGRLGLHDVISSDALCTLLMTPYNLLFRLSDDTMKYEVRRGHFRISVYITRYFD